MRLLDRYLLQNFLVPFLLCFGAFLAIWFVFDLRGNSNDFIEGHASAKFVAYFYLTQLPQVCVMSLPVGLLLAMLFAMSKMSRSNEIIAMLTAGRSLARLLAPLLAASLVITGASLALNYAAAPHAELMRKQLLSQVGRRRDRNPSLGGLLFRNRQEGRTWYVERMPRRASDDAVLTDVEVIAQDPEGRILTKWYAKRVAYLAANRTWRLENGKKVEFDTEGNIKTDKMFEVLEIDTWRETPWRIAASEMDAQSLSVPELKLYLRYNADFPAAQLAPYETHLWYRWALPWQCAVVALIAAPLGIVYSRRAALTGIATAIFLFAGMLLVTNLTLALGKGCRVPGAVAAWTPPVLFGGIGLLLVFLRSTNRELPRPSQWFRSRPAARRV